MRSSNKRVSLSVGIVCALAVAATSAIVAAPTPPGTEIQAAAEAEYSTPGGDQMPTTTSNTVIVTVDYPSSISIGAAKTLQDGQFVQLVPNVVTGGTAEIVGAFYIEAADRSAGIRVATSQTVREGDRATVSGSLATLNGERRINAMNVAIVSSGNTLPGPLGMIQGSFGTGLDSTGLLMKLWGRVTAAPSGSGYFYLDDGSALNDDSAYTGIRILGAPPNDPGSKYLAVIGIAGVEMLGSWPIRAIRTRRAADIVVVGSVP
ncbi:MAG TPA: hypothetical protein VMX94_09685 [Armatimonadota bacterium]|nr:hypothetical protein [Armatimonadota bacterium]